YLPESELATRVEALLGVNGKREAVESALARLALEARVVREDGTVFLEELHAAEREAAARLAELARAPAKLGKPLDAEKALAWVQKETGRELAAAQRDALVKAAGGKVVVITGGPGTGKTTVVDAICRVVRARHERVMLAAPTGRAAKRLAEATGLEAKTVHRALEFDPKGGGFIRGRETPLETDVLVVDECSMVDLPLFTSILDAVPDGARLVMVGDADQLPSVGPGNVLRDVIASGVVPVVRLKEIFRQAARSGIVTNAHRVNEGEIPSLEAADFFVVGREEPEAAVEAVCEMVAERIPQKFGLDPIRDVQVLAPMNRGVAGTANLNLALQARLNPNGREVQIGPRRFRLGDRVLQMRNDYDKEVYNGDLGRVVANDDEGIEVEIDGRRVRYDASDSDDLTLAYATTIHRSQGSEYPAVVVPLLTQHFVMLQRNLLYTAITRGKKLVVLVGSKRAIAMAVKNDEGSARWTKLAQRLREANA
ncbi:MAG TPA: AAA family ATPase, partial [bacterium]|nr:AAA family ATPase [bacterium]